MGTILGIDEIKKLYPDEWVLIGNPITDETRINVLQGIPIYHSMDKKEVCYLGRDKTTEYNRIKLIYTGTFKPMRKIATVFNRNKI